MFVQVWGFFLFFFPLCICTCFWEIKLWNLFLPAEVIGYTEKLLKYNSLIEDQLHKNPCLVNQAYAFDILLLKVFLYKLGSAHVCLAILS